MCQRCKGSGKGQVQCGRNEPVDICCRECRGTGKSKDLVMCKVCFDTGKVTKMTGYIAIIEVDCPNCKKEKK